MNYVRYPPVKIIVIFWKFNPEVKKKKTQEEGNNQETETATFHLQHKHYFIWFEISKELRPVCINKPSRFEKNIEIGQEILKKMSQYTEAKQE